MFGLLDGVFEDVEEIARRDAVGFEALERLDGGRARWGSCAAEAVGDGEQAGPCIGGVLVALADKARVGKSGVTDSQGLGGRRHSGVLPGQMADEEGSEVSPRGGVGLDLGPKRADLPGCRACLQRADVLDAGQGHPQAPEPGDQPGLVQLFRGVETVAGHRVDASGGQQSELVVETQRLR